MKTNIFVDDIAPKDKEYLEDLYQKFVEAKELLDEHVEIAKKLSKECETYYSQELLNCIQATGRFEQNAETTLLDFLKACTKLVKKDINIIKEFNIDQKFCKDFFESTIYDENNMISSPRQNRRNSSNYAKTRKLLINSGLKYDISDLEELEKLFLKGQTPSYKQKLRAEMKTYGINVDTPAPKKDDKDKQ